MALQSLFNIKFKTRLSKELVAFLQVVYLLNSSPALILKINLKIFQKTVGDPKNQGGYILGNPEIYYLSIMA